MMWRELGPILLFLSFKTSEGESLIIAATWHVVPDTQICPRASSSTSLFSLVDFSEKMTGDRVNREKQKKKRFQEEFKSISSSSLCYICSRVLLEMKHQCNSTKI